MNNHRSSPADARSAADERPIRWESADSAATGPHPTVPISTAIAQAAQAKEEAEAAMRAAEEALQRAIAAEFPIKVGQLVRSRIGRGGGSKTAMFRVSRVTGTVGTMGNPTEATIRIYGFRVLQDNTLASTAMHLWRGSEPAEDDTDVVPLPLELVGRHMNPGERR